MRLVVAGFFPNPEPLERCRRIALMASHRAAVEAARSNAGSRTLERLAEIAVPTLIVQGRHDRARTVEHGAAMRDRIAGARLEVLEEPEPFHRLALPFLLG